MICEECGKKYDDSLSNCPSCMAVNTVLQMKNMGCVLSEPQTKDIEQIKRERKERKEELEALEANKRKYRSYTQLNGQTVYYTNYNIKIGKFVVKTDSIDISVAVIYFVLFFIMVLTLIRFSLIPLIIATVITGVVAFFFFRSVNKGFPIRQKLLVLIAIFTSSFFIVLAPIKHYYSLDYYKYDGVVYSRYHGHYYCYADDHYQLINKNDMPSELTDNMYGYVYHLGSNKYLYEKYDITRYID